MARTGQKYLASIYISYIAHNSKKNIYRYFKMSFQVMDASSFPDRLFTACLIALTMVAILVLFWFQNFGPGFHFQHVKH